MTDTERASYWFDRAGQLLASLSEAQQEISRHAEARAATEQAAALLQHQLTEAEARERRLQEAHLAQCQRSEAEAARRAHAEAQLTKVEARLKETEQQVLELSAANAAAAATAAAALEPERSKGGQDETSEELQHCRALLEERRQQLESQRQMSSQLTQIAQLQQQLLSKTAELPSTQPDATQSPELQPQPPQQQRHAEEPPTEPQEPPLTEPSEPPPQPQPPPPPPPPAEAPAATPTQQTSPAPPPAEASLGAMESAEAWQRRVQLLQASFEEVLLYAHAREAHWRERYAARVDEHRALQREQCKQRIKCVDLQRSLDPAQPMSTPARGSSAVSAYAAEPEAPEGSAVEASPARNGPCCSASDGEIFMLRGGAGVYNRPPSAHFNQPTRSGGCRPMRFADRGLPHYRTATKSWVAHVES